MIKQKTKNMLDVPLRSHAAHASAAMRLSSVPVAADALQLRNTTL
jgi:hypothetical protein